MASRNPIVSLSCNMSESRIISGASFIAMHTAPVCRTKMDERESMIMLDTHRIAETAMK